tara:strand:- start:1380 stop:1790 length:411 start_codon:yes stop_codon:yes gene_type:complete
MLRASTTEIAIGTPWPSAVPSPPIDLVVGTARFEALTVATGATTSVTGVVNLTGYASVKVFLITKAAANNGGGVQYQESPDGVNWTALTPWGSALGATAAGTQVRTLSNVKYVRFTMATAGGAGDSLTANIVVYAV